MLDREVAEQAGRIRRGIRIKLPDALIAATALVTRRELVTRNARDFRKVKGLRLASRKCRGSANQLRHPSPDCRMMAASEGIQQRARGATFVVRWLGKPQQPVPYTALEFET